jgi:hypothetical protein
LRNFTEQRMFLSMNCRTVFSITALSALTACQSPGALAQKAPAWTAVYQVSYESMANCLVERERLPLVTVTPSTYPAERRATGLRRRPDRLRSGGV